MNYILYFKPGTEARLTWFKDSPDAGDPRCVCSWCGEKITEDDEIPMRIFNNKNEEARMHQACSRSVIDWEKVASQTGVRE